MRFTKYVSRRKNTSILLQNRLIKKEYKIKNNLSHSKYLCQKSCIVEICICPVLESERLAL